MDRFNELIKKYFDSPLVAVFGALTIVTTFWGIVSIYKDISEWGGSRLGALIVAGFAGLLVLFVFASYLLPSVHRQYAIAFNARYIFTEINRTWEIDSAGNGVMNNDKTYLFFDKPDKDDLHDTVLGSEKLNLGDINYQSTDSTQQDYEQMSDIMQRIYWKPKQGEIAVGTPYMHNVKSNFPYLDKNLPEYKIMTIVAPVFTLKFKVTVKSQLPIKEVVAFKERTFQKFKDADGIARRGKRIRRTMAPLPSVTNSHDVTWAIDNLPGSTVYYLILYFNSTLA